VSAEIFFGLKKGNDSSTLCSLMSYALNLFSARVQVYSKINTLKQYKSPKMCIQMLHAMHMYVCSSTL